MIPWNELAGKRIVKERVKYKSLIRRKLRAVNVEYWQLFLVIGTHNFDTVDGPINIIYIYISQLEDPANSSTYQQMFPKIRT